MSTPKRFKANQEEVPLFVNGCYVDEDYKKGITEAWRSTGLESEHSKGHSHLVPSPFPCCVLPDFIAQDPAHAGPSSQACRDGLAGLEEELGRLVLSRKCNDLYQFRQSRDLMSSQSPYIKAFCNMLTKQCLPWLRDVTGIPLNGTIDVTSSKYEYTDVLLCHDDQLEGRRIAFIYYLVPPSWPAKNGGRLDLFQSDKHGCPAEVVHSVLPQRNGFVFFEVSPRSFHQVSEVLSGTQARLSLNGWFHGPAPRPPDAPPPAPPPAPPMHTLLPMDVALLELWVNPLYLDQGSARLIREEFEEESQVELQTFLAEDKYQELCLLLWQHQLHWNQSGPANKQCLLVSDESEWAGAIRELMALLRSNAFGLLLSHLTGVELAKLPEEEGPGSSSPTIPTCDGLCHCDLVKVQQGSYSLVQDADFDSDQFCLDGRLFFMQNDEEWQLQCGGGLVYLARDEDEELLTIVPTPNSLALVYRDRDTVGFLKYVNSRVLEREHPHYIMGALCYREPNVFAPEP